MMWIDRTRQDRSLTSLEDGDGKKMKLLLPGLVLKQSRFEFEGNLEIIHIKFKYFLVCTGNISWTQVRRPNFWPRFLLTLWKHLN